MTYGNKLTKISKIQTGKRLKGMMLKLLLTKRNMQMFKVSPFFKLQNNN